MPDYLITTSSTITHTYECSAPSEDDVQRLFEEQEEIWDPDSPLHWKLIDEETCDTTIEDIELEP